MLELEMKEFKLSYYGVTTTQKNLLGAKTLAIHGKDFKYKEVILSGLQQFTNLKWLHLYHLDIPKGVLYIGSKQLEHLELCKVKMVDYEWLDSIKSIKKIITDYFSVDCALKIVKSKKVKSLIVGEGITNNKIKSLLPKLSEVEKYLKYLEINGLSLQEVKKSFDNSNSSTYFIRDSVTGKTTGPLPIQPPNKVILPPVVDENGLLIDGLIPVSAYQNFEVDYSKGIHYEDSPEKIQETSPSSTTEEETIPFTFKDLEKFKKDFLKLEIDFKKLQKDISNKLTEEQKEKIFKHISELNKDIWSKLSISEQETLTTQTSAIENSTESSKENLFIMDSNKK